jgi:hypothetical protein
MYIYVSTATVTKVTNGCLGKHLLIQIVQIDNQQVPDRSPQLSAKVQVKQSNCAHLKNIAVSIIETVTPLSVLGHTLNF